MTYTKEYFQKSADYIQDKTGFQPEVAVILGSGLGPVAGEIQNAVEIDYADIPNFLLSTVKDHAGKLIAGELCGRKVICMSGRFHYYEGYDFEQLVIPVRVLYLLGVRALVLTNAAGGVNASFRPGDVMIITDHIKLMGASPLRGPNAEEFGPRFFDVGSMYSPQLVELAEEAAAATDLRVHKGVYYFCTGPQFETPAEIRAMRTLGADAVGMSTVTEALTAAHCGLPLLALSLITNMAAGMENKPLSGKDVGITAERSSAQFIQYFKAILSKM